MNCRTLVAASVFGLLASVELFAFQSVPASPQAGIPAAWRNSLASPTHAEKLAAALLLASRGDETGTSAVLAMLPKMTENELTVARDFLADKQFDFDKPEDRLGWEDNFINPSRGSNGLDKTEYRPALVKALLALPGAYHGISIDDSISIIPPGRESEYTPEILSLFDRWAHLTPGQPPKQQAGSFSNPVAFAMIRLIRTHDQAALERMAEYIKSDPANDYLFLDNTGIATLPGVPAHAIAELQLARYDIDPIRGLDALDSDIPYGGHAGIRSIYLELLAARGKYEAAIQLWRQRYAAIMANSSLKPEFVMMNNSGPVTDARYKSGEDARILGASIAKYWTSFPPELRNQLTADQSNLLPPPADGTPMLNGMKISSGRIDAKPKPAPVTLQSLRAKLEM